MIDHTLRYGLEERAIAGFAGAQCGFGLLARGDVEDDAGPGQAAVVADTRLRLGREPLDGIVLAFDPKLMPPLALQQRGDAYRVVILGTVLVENPIESEMLAGIDRLRGEADQVLDAGAHETEPRFSPGRLDTAKHRPGYRRSQIGQQ